MCFWGRPAIFLRFEVSLQGKHARRVWRDHAELFASWTRQRSKLNEAETAMVPTPPSLLQFIQGNFQPRSMMPADPRRGPETAFLWLAAK